MEFHVSAGLEFSREKLGAKEDQPVVLSLNIHIHSHLSNTPQTLRAHITHNNTRIIDREYFNSKLNIFTNIYITICLSP